MAVNGMVLGKKYIHLAVKEGNNYSRISQVKFEPCQVLLSFSSPFVIPL